MVFELIHASSKKLRISFYNDDQSTHGEMMDAPDFLPIGCTSNRQDIVQRGFNALEAFVEVCMLRGYGQKAHMPAFEYECLFNRIPS